MNINKLNWFNEQHMRLAKIEDLVAELKPQVEKMLASRQLDSSQFDDEYYRQVIETIRVRYHQNKSFCNVLINHM